MKLRQMYIKYSAAVVVIIGYFSAPMTAVADTVSVEVPRTGTVKVTQREKPPTQNDNSYTQTLTVTRKNRNITSAVITKTIAGIGLGVQGGMEIDTDGNGINDSTQITVPVNFENSDNKNITYKSTQSLQNKDEKVVVKVGSTSSNPKEIKTQSGTEGKGTPREIPRSGRSIGRSVSYNAAISTLSFADDFITDTGFSNDPLIGASVNLPDFKFDGFSLDGKFAVFTVTTDERFTLISGTDVFYTASIDSIFYNIEDNYFGSDLFDLGLAGVDTSSPFYDANLTSIISPFIQQFEELLNPSSPSYDPGFIPGFNFIPEQNFFALTSGFQVPASSGGPNSLGLFKVVPEPTSTLSLLALGTIGAGSTLKRKLNSSKSTEKETTKVS